jgi:hypothetical protein
VRKQCFFGLPLFFKHANIDKGQKNREICHDVRGASFFLDILAPQSSFEKHQKFFSAELRL